MSPVLAVYLRARAYLKLLWSQWRLSSTMQICSVMLEQARYTAGGARVPSRVVGGGGGGGSSESTLLDHSNPLAGWPANVELASGQWL